MIAGCQERVFRLALRITRNQEAAEDSRQFREDPGAQGTDRRGWLRARPVFIRHGPGRACDARDSTISFRALGGVGLGFLGIGDSN